MFSYWFYRFNEFFYEFGFCYFMVYNRFVILNIEVIVGKVCVSYKNFSSFIVSIGYKFCMEIFFSYLDENFFKYFFFEDGIVIFCNVFFNGIYDVGYILVF